MNFLQQVGCLRTQIDEVTARMSLQDVVRLSGVNHTTLWKFLNHPAYLPSGTTILKLETFVRMVETVGGA